MKIFFLFVYSLLACFPFFYFYKLLKQEHRIFTYFLCLTTFLSIIGIIIRFTLSPYNTLFNIFILFSQFCLIYLYTLFIFVLFYRILSHKISFLPTKKGTIIVSVFCVLITAFGFYSHMNKIQTNYTITINKKTSIDHLKTCMLSDIHLGTGTYLDDLTNLKNTINQNNYDLVLLVGDIFDESTPKKMVEEALNIMKGFQSTYGTFSVSGNHEYLGQHTSFDVYKKYNIMYLSNEYICINDAFNIVGMEDNASHTDYSIKNIIKDMDLSLPTIVMDHNPKRYQEYLGFSDLQVSGHTHNGQLFPGNILLNYYYFDSYGLKYQDNHAVITTSGYGSWGLPYRLFTNCEWVCVNILFS